MVGSPCSASRAFTHASTWSHGIISPARNLSLNANTSTSKSATDATASDRARW